MTQDTCRLDGCDKPIKRASLCYGHYMKQWRYGTPTPIHPPRHRDLTGRRFGSLVVQERATNMWRCICDCGAETLTRTGDLNRGTVLSCGDVSVHYRRGDAGYSAAHERVRRDRGKAGDQQCIDGCGRSAYHWSYNHTDANERRDKALGITYSLDPSHYSPRCVPCHKRFDLDYLASA